MNVTMVATYDVVGGAMRSAYRLHKGFEAAGVPSRMVVRRKFSDDPRVHQVQLDAREYGWEHRLFSHLQEHRIGRRRTPLSNTPFSLPYPGFDLARTPLIEWADVINLHWVSRTLSVETVERLLQTGKPVVWTLHDQWPFTGGCHYTAGCDGFHGGCERCPQLENDEWGIPARVLENKLERWGDRLVIVTPSRWLAESARESRVFRNCRVEVIPYSLDTEVFRPSGREEARAKLGIRPEQRVILFGAVSHKEHRKGFDLLVDAMEHCKGDPRFAGMLERGEVVVLAFGRSVDEVEALGVPVVTTGYVDSDVDLAKIYSSADLFVLPSRQDNLPNTMIESMACGTPVVTFDVGGMPDLVVPGTTGAVVPPFDVAALGRAICDFVVNPEMANALGRECRRVMERDFVLPIQAERYAALFDELLGGIGRRGDVELGKAAARIDGWHSPLDARFGDLYRHGALELIGELDGAPD